MQTAPRHSGVMSQDSERGPVHRSDVKPEASTAAMNDAPPAIEPVRSASEAASVSAAEPALRPAIDPAARASKRMYDGLSASSAGLELGISVGLGVLFGSWLDGKLGTRPWMMLVFLIIGVIAGFRGLLRAVARAERAARRG
jgi:ATP synthase protein I